LKSALKSEFNTLMEEELYVEEWRLMPGYRCNEAVAGAICESVCMVVVYSPKYEREEYCQREFEGIEQRKGTLAAAWRGC
jgi:hypothetical protein